MTLMSKVTGGDSKMEVEKKETKKMQDNKEQYLSQRRVYSPNETVLLNAGLSMRGKVATWGC